MITSQRQNQLNWSRVKFEAIPLEAKYARKAGIFDALPTRQPNVEIDHKKYPSKALTKNLWLFHPCRVLASPESAEHDHNVLGNQENAHLLQLAIRFFLRFLLHYPLPITISDLIEDRYYRLVMQVNPNLGFLGSAEELRVILWKKWRNDGMMKYIQLINWECSYQCGSIDGSSIRRQLTGGISTMWIPHDILFSEIKETFENVLMDTTNSSFLFLVEGLDRTDSDIVIDDCSNLLPTFLKFAWQLIVWRDSFEVICIVRVYAWRY